MTSPITLRMADYAPAQISIYDKAGQKLFEELSVIALAPGRDGVVHARSKCVGVGRAALTETFPEGTLVGSPLKDGQVANAPFASKMFKKFAGMATLPKSIRMPIMGLCVPVALAEDDVRILDAIIRTELKARKVYIFESTYQDAGHEAYHEVVKVPAVVDYGVIRTSKDGGQEALNKCKVVVEILPEGF